MHAFPEYVLNSDERTQRFLHFEWMDKFSTYWTPEAFLDLEFTLFSINFRQESG